MLIRWSTGCRIRVWNYLFSSFTSQIYNMNPSQKINHSSGPSTFKTSFPIFLLSMVGAICLALTLFGFAKPTALPPTGSQLIVEGPFVSSSQKKTCLIHVKGKIPNAISVSIDGTKVVQKSTGGGITTIAVVVDDLISLPPNRR